MDYFFNSEGTKIIDDLIITIQDNKQYLSDIDGAIGDGDHGVNMSKGFTLCKKELEESSRDFSNNLKVLSNVLLDDIGGSMGPLYGMFFKAMSKATTGKDKIDKVIFAEMLTNAEKSIRKIGNAEVGDKTLLDTLVPAVKSFNQAVEEGKNFEEALKLMTVSAIGGRDSTKELIAKVGRASRLGERSKGHIDAGASSCCLILESMAKSINILLNIS